MNNIQRIHELIEWIILDRHQVQSIYTQSWVEEILCKLGIIAKVRCTNLEERSIKVVRFQIFIRNEEKIIELTSVDPSEYARSKVIDMLTYCIEKYYE